MAESIKVFENSLRDYLIKSLQDAYNNGTKIEYRYNNLKVFMEPQKNRIPHFYVSLNISEACISITPVQKLSGSIGTDDKYVLMWANRPNINGELLKHWEYLSKAMYVDIEEFLDENGVGNKAISKETQKKLAEDAHYVSDIITGTGSEAKLNNKP